MVETDDQVELHQPARRDERILFALRQAALVAVSLLIAGLVTERLRPDETLDRGIASTPFLWAIVAWLVVLLLNAVAFDRSQMAALERAPLYAGLIVGAFVLLTGLIGLDGGSLGRRLIYAVANGLGAVMFWWALTGIFVLLARRLTAEAD